MKPKPKSTSWGRVAKWYGEMVESDDSYQRQVILPNLLRLLKLKRGQMVLDIACGSGWFSREFFKAGAKVTGTDISEELIELARQSSPKEITFKVAPAEHQPMIKDRTIDKAVLIMALQNIERFGAALKEAARVLKADGKLYIVLNHPAFRVIQASSWGWDGTDRQYRRLDKYLSPFEVRIEMHPGIAPREVTTTFHRPLQAYVKALAAAGLAVTDFEEWVSHKVSDSGPRAKAENIARAEFPLFLCLTAIKV